MDRNLAELYQGIAGRPAIHPIGLRDNGGVSLGMINYGVRHDGSGLKGKGFWGPLKNSEGDVMTEYTINEDINGKPTEIPSFVPTLTLDQLTHLLRGGDITDEIRDKAYKHAQDRINQNKSPFRQSGEFYY